MKVGNLDKEEFSLENYDEWYSDHAFGLFEDYMNADNNLKRVKWVLDAVKENTTVLDLGCLDGFLLLTLAKKKGITGVGVDLSELGISIGIKNATENKLPIEFLCRKIEGLDLKKKFDYIVCAEVIEHVKDVDEIYKVIDAHLKPGGSVFLDTPDYDTPMGRENPDPLHIRYYTHKLEHEAEDAISLPKEIGEDRIVSMEVVDNLIQVEYK